MFKWLASLLGFKNLDPLYDQALRDLANCHEKMDSMEKRCEEFGEWARNRIAKLEDAIRLHRDEKGHDRCHLDDDRLYQVLNEPIPPRPLPPKEEFLAGCARFYEHRKKGGDYVTPPVDNGGSPFLVGDTVGRVGDGGNRYVGRVIRIQPATPVVAWTDIIDGSIEWVTPYAAEGLIHITKKE